MRCEISYDLRMNDNMAFVEGVFRVAGGEWQVFIFSRYPLDHAIIIPTNWESGASGIVVRFPESQTLSKTAVDQVMSEAIGVSEWVEVRGPDSMQLR